jgi:hypothetical protein
MACLVKRVYVCGSFRFLDRMRDVVETLKKENIPCEVSEKADAREITACLEKIDNADIVYVVDPDAYVGKSVCVDIGYAYAKRKQILAKCPVNDPPLAKIISGVLSPAELAKLVKKDSER